MARLAIVGLALTVLSGCGSSAASSAPSGRVAVSPTPLASPSQSAESPTPMPSISLVPTPGQTSAAAAAAPCLASSSSGTFLKTDGSSFTCAGKPVPLTGFTFYPALLGGAKAWHDPSFPSYIDHVLEMGAAAGQNLIRATDQWDKNTPGQRADDPVVWSNMDYLLAAARKKGMFVVVDLSAFRWLLMSQGADSTRADLWTPFIDQVAARYRDNPAVALYSIAGEPQTPATAGQLATLLDFYTTTSQTLRTADPNHLITVGGFNHMEDHPELNWWQSIDRLSTNDIIAVKTYSQHDLSLMPDIAAYAGTVGKPILDEEFGMPQGFGDASFVGGAAYNGLATGRAPFFNEVYSSGRALSFAGFIFWNMGCQIGPSSYEVSAATPAVWAVVARYGAVPSADPVALGRSLCG